MKRRRVRQGGVLKVKMLASFRFWKQCAKVARQAWPNWASLASRRTAGIARASPLSLRQARAADAFAAANCRPFMPFEKRAPQRCSKSLKRSTSVACARPVAGGGIGQPCGTTERHLAKPESFIGGTLLAWLSAGPISRRMWPHRLKAQRTR